MTSREPRTNKAVGLMLNCCAQVDNDMLLALHEKLKAKLQKREDRQITAKGIFEL